MVVDSILHDGSVRVGERSDAAHIWEVALDVVLQPAELTALFDLGDPGFGAVGAVGVSQDQDGSSPALVGQLQRVLDLAAAADTARPVGSSWNADLKTFIQLTNRRGQTRIDAGDNDKWNTALGELGNHLGRHSAPFGFENVLNNEQTVTYD